MGDPGDWVDQHGDALYRYARTRLRDPDRAADLVQETFLHALRGRSTFSGRSSERTWLISILKHKMIDQARASVRRRVLIDSLAAEESGRSEFDERGRWRQRPRAWRLRPEAAAESQEFRAALEGCLGRLPPALAETFLLREADELPASEVQDRLGISPANLWARLHRARASLRRCLEAAGIAQSSPPPAPSSPTPRPTDPLASVATTDRSIPPPRAKGQVPP